MPTGTHQAATIAAPSLHPSAHPAACAAPAAPGWARGWWSAARACPSPHFGPRPAHTPVYLAVVHSISLPPGEYGGTGIADLLAGRLDCAAHPYYASLRGVQVSSHFVIHRDGLVVQAVSVFDRAWHAGVSSHRGRSQCNDFSVGIELEGWAGHSFEPVQYTRLADLLRALAQQLPLQAVSGHEHIAPGRKDDPGAGFDWALLRALLHRADWDFPA